MSGNPDVTIRGLKEFRDALRQVDKSWGKAMGQANKKAADIMADAMRGDARAGTRQQAAAAPTFRAVADQLKAKVRAGGASAPFAGGAFMGARERFGWYAAKKFDGSRGRQFPAWVGNGWDPGDSLEAGHAPGEPYVIGRSINRKREAFMSAYGDIVSRVLTEKAFNE